ncbi:universal stress protein [Paenibacillus sp. NFR01]|uniref:universal stress protein n=1 Tax=Paenibacillus sp. NFR01 TaxID=1566279 RepID=UPI0008D06035|nr:universal stress protein [Paenibacillus sp. NFR01]SEU11035.1 Nucleotide-binding universal stress protein, UspA family [Paenibacillus sp. NFR01]
MYGHILVPMDGSGQAERALDSAIGLAKALSPAARLSVIHVQPVIALNEPTGSMDLEGALESEDRQILAAATAKLEGTGLSFETFYVHGDPSKVICKAAKEKSADLIIMGSRGVSFISELLLGSVSHSVAQHAPCAVMLVK